MVSTPLNIPSLKDRRKELENRVLYDNLDAVLETIKEAIRNKRLTSPAAPIT